MLVGTPACIVEAEKTLSSFRWHFASAGGLRSCPGLEAKKTRRIPNPLLTLMMNLHGSKSGSKHGSDNMASEGTYCVGSTVVPESNIETGRVAKN